MTSSVSMPVDQANLDNSLRFSFTHNTTVLGRLIQNAGRAKAFLIIRPLYMMIKIRLYHVTR
ncbi:MAG: hypothetical protein Q7U57_15890 [Methylovulum sp.]|nr:hypothetical protein [Methylovulum sp.]